MKVLVIPDPQYLSHAVSLLRDMPSRWVVHTLWPESSSIPIPSESPILAPVIKTPHGLVWENTFFRKHLVQSNWKIPYDVIICLVPSWVMIYQTNMVNTFLNYNVETFWVTAALDSLTVDDFLSSLTSNLWLLGNNVELDWDKLRMSVRPIHLKRLTENTQITVSGWPESIERRFWRYQESRRSLKPTSMLTLAKQAALAAASNGEFTFEDYVTKLRQFSRSDKEWGRIGDAISRAYLQDLLYRQGFTHGTNPYTYRPPASNPVTSHKNLDYQIVVARYDEPLDWLLSCQYPFIVYNKGDRSTIPEPLLPHTIDLPNVGRESHTYLYHIVKNYDRLAKRTLFIQAYYFDHPHFSDLSEYFTRDGHFVSAELRYGHKMDILGIPPKYAAVTERTNETLLEWFNRVIRKPIGHVMPFCVGANFSVTRDAILSNPIEYYQQLLGEVSHHPHPHCGYYFERSWWFVFTPDDQIRKYLKMEVS